MTTLTTFTLNGIRYSTSVEMLMAIESILPSAHETRDFSAVQALMILGIATYQIERISSNKDLGLES